MSVFSTLLVDVKDIQGESIKDIGVEIEASDNDIGVDVATSDDETVMDKVTIATTDELGEYSSVDVSVGEANKEWGTGIRNSVDEEV